MGVSSEQLLFYIKGQRCKHCFCCSCILQIGKKHKWTLVKGVEGTKNRVGGDLNAYIFIVFNSWTMWILFF